MPVSHYNMPIRHIVYLYPIYINKKMLMIKLIRLMIVFFILCGGVFFSMPTSTGASLTEEDKEIEGVRAGYYSAKISWSTDEPSTSQVDYGTSTHTYKYTTPEHTNLVTYHEIVLSNLEPSTVYHYRIRSKDAFGNEGISPDLMFRTMDLGIADNTPPEISNIKVASITGLREPTYISDEEARSIVAAGPAGPAPMQIAASDVQTQPQVNVELGQSSAGQLTKQEEPVEKTLIQKGGLLLPKGTWQVEPSVAYAHISANRISITGFTILPVLIIGEITSETVKRDILIETNTFRYGLGSNLQAEVKVPYRMQYERVTSADGTESTRDESGLGDIEGGIYYQCAFEHNWVPDLIAGLSVKSDTADKTPYETEGETGTGTGHWAVKGSLVAVKSSDPAIIFGSLNYTHNIERNITNYGDVNPGDTLGYSMGMTFALNYQTALNLQLEHNVTSKMEIDGVPVNGSFTNVASFKYGLVWSINKDFSCDVSASHGLTEDSPDMVIEVRFPYTF